jgi:surface polysaccharide O-acyltransferase-like enzyme
MTVLFAKATIHLIEPTLFQNNNQFTSIEAYMFTVITLFTAVSQIYWINNGLARYDALIQIPVFYVSWTLFDVVGGGIYYEEFRGFSVHQFILFCLGIVVIFCGVFVLAGRLKSISDSEKKES